MASTEETQERNFEQENDDLRQKFLELQQKFSQIEQEKDDLRQENDDLRQKFQCSEGTLSSRSSRKRKRNDERKDFWQDILAETSIADKDKTLHALRFVPLEVFCNSTVSERAEFCEQIGLTGWGDDLVMRAAKVIKTEVIPSPSGMQARHIKLIADTSKISHFKPSEDEDVDDCTLEFLKRMKMYFRNKTEAEAMFNVLLYISSAIATMDDNQGLQIQLQPTVGSFKTFSDVYVIVLDSGTPRCFIEIKSLTYYTDLTDMESEHTAQALREAHILLCELQCADEIPFVLTNSKLWSFGYAKRIGSKICLDKVMTINLRSPGLASKKLIPALKSILRGEFPHGKEIIP